MVGLARYAEDPAEFVDFVEGFHVDGAVAGFDGGGVEGECGGFEGYFE